ITLSCVPEGKYGPAILGDEPTRSLNVTVKLSKDVTMDTRRCKKELKELLFRAREGEQEVGISATHRQVDPKRPSLLHSRQEEAPETNFEGQRYQGIVEYFMSTIQRRAVQAVDS